MEEIREQLTNKAVEERLLRRVALKASFYGSDITDTGVLTPSSPPIISGGSPVPSSGTYKVDPLVVKDIYEKFIIPLTIKVEIDYLLQGLSSRKE